MTVFKSGSSGTIIIYRTRCTTSAEKADNDKRNAEISEEHDQARPEPLSFRFYFTAERLFHVISPVELVLRIPVQVQPFHGVAEERLRNHNFIIPRPKKKSKGNIDENVGNRLLCSTADFLPGACRKQKHY